ncbi:MAG: SGNH/GDSL hydrolase family protein [Bacteroidales bacterium]|nr:SGNH/GDSL hydrolase family protein [Bacteroidales bacterium]
MTKKNLKKTNSWFFRNPVKSVSATIVIFILLLDLVSGALFIPGNYNTFRCSHPYYHHDFYPNREALTKWGKQEYIMYTNSLGFRDSAIREIPLSDDKKRILFLGDSFIEGLGVKWEESVAGILNQKMEAGKRETEILNAAAVSYSPLLYYLKTEYLIEKKGLVFDEVYVFIDISDIQDEIFYRDFKPEEPSAMKRCLSDFRKFISGHSFIYYSISKLTSPAQIDNAFYVEEMANINVWFENIDGYLNRENPEEGRFIWTLDEAVFNSWGKAGLKSAGGNIKKLHELCQGKGIPLSLAVYPAPHQIMAGDLNSKQVAYWEAFCNRYGIPFINFFPDFIADRDPETTYREYFIPGDTHWNRKGNKLIADRLFDVITGANHHE